MELEIANNKIKELQEKLLNIESNQIQRTSEEIAELEYCKDKIKLLTNENEYLTKEIDYLKDQLYRYDQFTKELHQRLEDRELVIEDQRIYCYELERQIGELRIENESQETRISNLQSQVEIQSKSIASQVEQFKSQYSLRLMESQDQIIKLQKIVKDKENSISIQNSAISFEPMCDLQNELNKNIKILNQKLKNFNSIRPKQ